MKPSPRYQPSATQIWQGRDDGSGHERLHQWVRCVEPQALPVQAKGKASFALCGFACDEGVRRNRGRPGASEGPDAFRQMLANLYRHAPNPKPLFDVGNVICPDGDLEASQAELANVVNHCLRAGCMTLICGGGHETAWGHYLGLAPHLGDKFLALINFDAHFDLRPLLPADKGSSGTPFTQIAAHCAEQGRPFNYTCIGVQKFGNSASLFQRAADLGTRYILAEQLQQNGNKEANALLASVLAQTDSVYLSLCLDVFAASVAPGVSAPQPMGLYPSQVLPLLQQILASGKVIAVDIVELAPRLDQGMQTAKLAAQLAMEILDAH